MMRIVGPIVLIVIAAGVFFGLGEPMFDEISKLQAQKSAYDEAIDNAQEFRSVRDDLNARYSRIPTDQLNRLNKLLPTEFENIRLVNDISGMATRNGMLIKSVNFGTSASNTEVAPAVPGSPNAVTIRLATSGTYRSLRGFLNEIEKSLRVADITALTFNSLDKEVYNYEMEVRTYWMK